MRLVVVPRTIESSTTMSRLPATTSRSGLSLIVTPRWRMPLRGLDERPPGVAVAVHALAVGQPAGLGVAGRRRRAGVRDGHDQVGVDRVLDGQLLAHPAADLVQVAALHVRVGPGEVDELEHAQRRVRLGVADRARRLDPARGRRSRRARRRARPRRRRCRGWPSPTTGTSPARRPARTGRRAGRRRPAPAGGQLAEHERSEAVRVAHADDPLLVEDDQAERAADAGQDLAAGPRPCPPPAHRRGGR